MLFGINLSIQVSSEGVQSIFQRCSKRPHQLLLSRNFPLSFVRLANIFPTFFRKSEIGGIPYSTFLKRTSLPIDLSSNCVIKPLADFLWTNLRTTC